MQTFLLERRGETLLSTWGVLRAPDGTLLCRILERGAGNPDHPRIRAGLYRLEHKPLGASRFDAAFGALIGPGYRGVLWLPDVPGRSDIEIHTANRVDQLLGCLATGERIARDGNYSIPGGASRPAYARIYPILLAAIPDGAQLRITDITKQGVYT